MRVEIELPPKLVPVFAPPRGEVRYRGAYGGRGSGKSYTFAKMAAVFGYVEPLRILCLREYQNSIDESFYAEVKNAIASIPWLADHYEIGESFIRGRNGTQFLFKGLRRNAQSIKSMAQVDIAIIEEAEDIPEKSWVDLEPTIRKPGSELWVIWNPRDKASPVNKRLRDNPPPRSAIVEINYLDNPWFPAELEEQRRHQQNTLDTGLYTHIWEGRYLERSDALVLGNCVQVEAFEPVDGWDGPYLGADWGFAADPTALVKCWVYERTLYIEQEAYGTGVETDDLPALFGRIEGAAQYVIRADNARPENISYVKRHGYPRAVAADKWPGSVEDGISKLRSFERIVIHPRCQNTIKESRLWSYKTDRLTGDVLPDLIDANNHCWDAIRYALQPMIRNKPARQPLATGGTRIL